ncbi:hypothetical protein V5O48_012815, partial [Marasmius crinis-equi]
KALVDSITRNAGCELHFDEETTNTVQKLCDFLTSSAPNHVANETEAPVLRHGLSVVNLHAQRLQDRLNVLLSRCIDGEDARSPADSAEEEMLQGLSKLRKKLLAQSYRWRSAYLFLRSDDVPEFPPLFPVLEEFVVRDLGYPPQSTTPFCPQGLLQVPQPREPIFLLKQHDIAMLELIYLHVSMDEDSPVPLFATERLVTAKLRSIHVDSLEAKSLTRVFSLLQKVTDSLCELTLSSLSYLPRVLREIVLPQLERLTFVQVRRTVSCQVLHLLTTPNLRTFELIGDYLSIDIDDEPDEDEFHRIRGFPDFKVVEEFADRSGVKETLLSLKVEDSDPAFTPADMQRIVVLFPLLKSLRLKLQSPRKSLIHLFPHIPNFTYDRFVAFGYESEVEDCHNQ